MERKLIFPPHIYATVKRPDIVLYSQNLHRVLLVELTCPAEEGIAAAHTRKLISYTPLKNAINDDSENKFLASIHTIEVGARGFVAHSLPRFLRGIGMSKRKSSALCKSVSRVASTCTHAIFNAKTNKHWLQKDYVIVHSAPKNKSNASIEATDFLAKLEPVLANEEKTSCSNSSSGNISGMDHFQQDAADFEKQFEAELGIEMEMR